MQRKERAAAGGRDADSPWAIPADGWKAVLGRTWTEAGNDHIDLIAAGVAFYGFLALVPLLGALVLSYGLIADPATVLHNMQALTAVMPADAAKLIGEQLMNVVHASDGKKGFGLLLALAIALYGVMKGALAIVTALDIAYEERETRGMIQLYLLALGITIAAVVMAIVAMIAIAALGHLDDIFPFAPAALLAVGKLLSYALMAAVGAATCATLYRYGPDREAARWTWLTPGSIAATGLWLAITFGFGVYVANFGNYNATYGSLGAVMVLLTWLYLSAYVLLLGAELNAELEFQTARDSTTGTPLPLGARGARVADTVAGDAPVATAADPAAGATPAAGRDLLVTGLATRAVAVARGTPAGALPVLLAGGGLTILRHRRGTPLGMTLLVAAGALAWFGRDRGVERDRPLDA